MMKKKRLSFSGLIILIVLFGFCSVPIQAEDSEDKMESLELSTEDSRIISPKEGTYSDKVSINVEEGDITNVLNAFSQQTGKNIVIGKGVSGTVTMRLKDVPWDEALNVILRPYGYAYEIIGNTVVINLTDKIVKSEQVEPLASKIFDLKYLDSWDVKDIIEAQLSPRGRFSILTVRGQKGWEFGVGASGSRTGASSSRTDSEGVSSMYKHERIKGDEEIIKSKTLVVTDVPPVISRISEIIKRIDRKPQQILIEARFMEVNRDKLKDMGLEFGTGSTGTESSTLTGTEIDNSYSFGANQLGSQVTPYAFDPKSTSLSGVEPYNTGLSLMFKHLTGTQFQVLLHALEEDASANTLSAPRILTLDNQEASILVGTKYPILVANIASATSAVTSTSLDYYEDIGIQLNVVPQICTDGYINMIIHPAVTSSSTQVEAKTADNITLAKYPIIVSREAETQILIKSGDTIVIGGLLKDVVKTTKFKVPLLGDIPFLGLLFRRETTDTEKIELLIFITATITPSEALTATVEPTFQEIEGEDTIIWGKEFDKIKNEDAEKR